MFQLGAMLLLLRTTLRRVFARGLPLHELARQLHEMGNRTLPLVLVGLGCFGAALVAHADHEAKPIVQDIVVVGPPALHLLTRELGPILVGGLAALQLGSMIAAELGTMAEGEQLEALVMTGGDPYAELVAPRLVAGVLVMPVLFTAGLAMAALCARLTATYVYGSDGAAWTDALMTSRGDFVYGYAKAAIMGLAIPLAGSLHGLRARGGASAVGAATTAGAVTSFLAMMAIDLGAAALSAALGAY